MFLNLSKGSVLYGLNRKANNKVFTGTVESVSMPRSKYAQTTFGQLPETVVDIVAIINGERREFQQVPSNNVVADFGPDTLVLSDSRESLTNYIRSLRQESKNIVDSYPMHKARIPEYDAALNELSPNPVNDSAVKELKEQVGSLQSQLAEALSLLKAKTESK